MHPAARLLGVESEKVPQQQHLAMLLAEPFESVFHDLPVFFSLDRGDRSGRGGTLPRRRLTFLGGEVVVGVAQAMVDDAAEPP